MGYVVFGAGAIGAVVGGRLFQAGYDVTLIARGEHLAALQARGLRVESPAGADTVRVAAVGHPREIDWRTSHVVLMAMKSQHTLVALSELAVVAPPETRIVCLQNGIANEPAALRMFPNVQAVSVACPTSHLEPGVVQAWSTPVTGLLDIGRYPVGIDQVSEAVAAVLATKGIRVRHECVRSSFNPAALLTRLHRLGRDRAARHRHRPGQRSGRR